MVIDTTITLEHWQEFVKYLSRLFKRARPRSKLWHEWLIDAVIWGVFFIILFILIDDFQWQSALLASVFFFFTFVDWLMFMARKGSNIIPRDDGVILGKKRYELGESGIAVNGNQLELHIGWSAFTDIYESNNIIVLIIEDLDGVIIPKADIDDCASFLATVRTYMSVNSGTQVE